MMDSSTLPRRCAARLTAHAARMLSMEHPEWATAMQHELHYINRDFAALLWALGCVWTAYSQRLQKKLLGWCGSIGLSVLMVFVVIPISLCFMTWYVLMLGQLYLPPGMHRFWVGAALMLLAGLCAPGSWRRRLLVGGTFPFVAFVAYLAAGIAVWCSGWAFGLFSIKSRWLLALEMVISGATFAVVLVTLLVLPFSLIYRRSAGILMMLALLPTLSMFMHHWFASFLHDHNSWKLFALLAPWLLTVVLVAKTVRICNRFLPVWVK